MSVIGGGSYTTTSLSGQVSGFDTTSQITSQAEADCFWNKSPYSFIARYISNYNTEQSGDLSSDELAYLTSAGWRVAVIQHALAGSTVLTASMGTNYGKIAVNNALSIGLPAGTYLWLDIENYGSGSDPVGFCENWSKAVTGNSNYHPALYYGAPGLSSAQVKTLLADGYFEDAWSGCGQTTGIGEALEQGPCYRTMAETCTTSYSVSGDEDIILSGRTVNGFVVAG